MRRTVLSVVVTTALTLAAVGCTGAGESTEPTAASSSSAPTLLERVLSDYNPRNDAAIAAAGHYDASLWKTVRTGAALEMELFRTRYNEVFSQPAESTVSLQRLAQFGTAPEGYPRWVLGAFAPPPTATATEAGSATATGESPADQPSGQPSADQRAEVAVFEQASEGAPWLMSQEIAARRSALPDEPAGEVATLEQQQNATVIAQLLATWFTSGEAPAWLGLGEAAALRAQQVDPGEFSQRSVRCSLYSDAVAQTGLSDAVRVARAGSTSLIAVGLRCSTTTVARKGRGVGWTGGMEKLYPNQRGGASANAPWVAMILLAHPDGAIPDVIGVTAERVL